VNIPDECYAKTFYRDSLPLREQVKESYRGTECESMRFEHAVYRGIKCILGFVIVIIGFAVAGIYTKVKGDAVGGFTIAGIATLLVTWVSIS
jgi:hypothetical protein